jgi:hypothetical protein
MGPDDQRPEHDGVAFFRPICIAEMLGGAVYRYVDFCGRCRKQMGQPKQFCPRCGAGIAHYVFAMGVVTWTPKDWRDELPDQLPDFSQEGCGDCFALPASAEKRLSSGAIASDLESHGSS